MKSSITFAFSLFLFTINLSFAQQKSQILKSNSKTLSVKERGVFKKGIWQLSTDISIDIYEPDNKYIEQKITFYSDIDSLTFDVKPNSIYDFIILLNNKIEFKTRISTKINRYKKDCNGCTISSDTIPFLVSSDDRIIIQGKINNEAELNFMFDTGANASWLYTSGFNKLPNIKFNGVGTNIGLGGQIATKYSSNNKLQISELIWDTIEIGYWGEQLKKFDGGIGYTLFEGNVLEINFDQNKLIAHNSLPNIEKDYTKCKFEKKDGLFFIELKLKIGDKIVTEWFDFDTGNSGTMNIHDGFATKENVFSLLKKTGEGRAKGSDGNKSKTIKAELPSLFIGDYELNNIPIFVESSSNNQNLPFSIIGIELISRFNVIIDYQNEYIYLKPNNSFKKSFKKKR